MAVNQPSRQDLDASVRRAQNDLKSALDNLGILKAFVDGYTAAQLMDGTTGYAYAQADVDNLKAFVAQHPLLTATQPMIDALTFGGRLAGVNFVRR